MTGSYPYNQPHARNHYFSANNDLLYITGSNDRKNEPYLNFEDDTVMDKLVARMMVHTQKVIIPCKFCGSHNAFSNPTCVQCGGPLGA